MRNSIPPDPTRIYKITAEALDQPRVSVQEMADFFGERRNQATADIKTVYDAMSLLDTYPFHDDVYSSFKISNNALLDVHNQLSRELGLRKTLGEEYKAGNVEQMNTLNLREEAHQNASNAIAAGNFFFVLDILKNRPETPDNQPLIKNPLRTDSAIVQHGRIRKHNTTKKEFLSQLQVMHPEVTLDDLQEKAVLTFEERAAASKVLMIVDAVQGLSHFSNQAIYRPLKLKQYLRNQVAGQVETLFTNYLSGLMPVEDIDKLYHQVFAKLAAIHPQLQPGSSKDNATYALDYYADLQKGYGQITDKIMAWRRMKQSGASNETETRATAVTSPTYSPSATPKAVEIPPVPLPQTNEIEFSFNNEIEEPMEIQIDPALVELQKQHDSDVEAYKQFLAAYRPSNKQLDKLGLTALLRPLVDGFEDPEQGVVFDGTVFEPKARRALQTLKGLMTLTSSTRGSLKLAVEAELQREDHLVNSVLQSAIALRTVGLPYKTAQPDFLKDLLWMQEQCQVLVAAVEQYIPATARESYTSLLHELFYVEPRKPMSLLDLAAVIVSPAPEPSEEVETLDVELTTEHTELVNDDVLLEVQPHETLNAVELDNQRVLSEEVVAAIKQLDWEVFPAEASVNDIVEYTRSNFSSNAVSRIEWGRIKDLMSVQAAFGGVVHRAKAGALSSKEPYYVLRCEIEGKKFSIAEQPIYGNATYVLREDLSEYGASWKEVFEQTRTFAALLGARPVVHNQVDHLQKVLDKIADELIK